jgi:hypothetical protein
LKIETGHLFLGKSPSINTSIDGICTLCSVFERNTDIFGRKNSANGGISVASPMLGGKMTQSSAKRPKAAESGARAADQKDRLSDIADDTLGFLTDIAAAANAKLGEARSGGPESFAVVNTLTGANAVQNISDISAEQRKQLVDLSREPAIARLVLRDEAGEETVYFIARAGTISNERHAMASYRSPIGRMASLPVGGDQEVRTSKGTRNFEVAERAVLQRLSGTINGIHATRCCRGVATVPSP